MASSSSHAHHGAAAAAGAFACAVCGSHEATPNQDDELVCDICGTLSQLTVAESHGYDDAVSGGHIARAGRGNIVRAGLGVGRAAVGGGGAEGDKKAAAAGSAKGPPTSAAALREATKACLLAYQTILRALGEALARLVDAPLGPLLQALEELWFLYLDAWRERGRYPIGYCFLGGSGGTGRYLKDFGALLEVQTLRKREGRKTRGVPAATVAALARIGVTLPGIDVDANADADGDGDGGGSTASAASSDDDDEQDEDDAMDMDGQQGRKRKRGQQQQQGRPTGGGRREVELSSDALLTMPMLLAFLDLAAQQLRLGQVLPHRLTRWCEEGALPYLQAWGLLPAELRTQLSRLDGPGFFFRTTARRLPTPGDTYRNSARLVAALRLEKPPPNVPLMAQTLLHDLGLLAPPTEAAAAPASASSSSSSSPSSSSSSSSEDGQSNNAAGEAVLECCLRFWARAQRETAAPSDGPGGDKQRKRQRWWASIVAEIGDDPAVLFAVVLMAVRLATPAPFPPPSAGADALGWEGWGWEAPSSPSSSAAAAATAGGDSSSRNSSLAIPHTLEGLCALPAAALRDGDDDGGYARWYRRVVLGTPTPTTATATATTQSIAEEVEEQEERTAALAGGLWGAEHGRTLQTLASASSTGGAAAIATAGTASPFLPSALKQPTTQPARPDRPTNHTRGVKQEDGGPPPPAAASVALIASSEKKKAAPRAVVPIERERSALARSLEPQRVVETAESVAGKVPYTVYAGADETGLVHDHLWALVERGAALLQVPPAYLLRHVLSLDQHLFPPRPAQRPAWDRHTKWWDDDTHEFLLQAEREGVAGGSESESSESSEEDDDDKDGGGSGRRMPRRVMGGRTRCSP